MSTKKKQQQQMKIESHASVHVFSSKSQESSFHTCILGQKLKNEIKVDSHTLSFITRIVK